MSKIRLNSPDRGLLEISVRHRIGSIELRMEENKERYEQTEGTEKEIFHKWIDLFREELNQLRDLASKLYNSRSRGLTYDGEGVITEHVK